MCLSTITASKAACSTTPDRRVELRLRVRPRTDLRAAPNVEVVRGQLDNVHLGDVVEQVMDVFPLGGIDARS
jgi:hypothetical protein